MRNEIVIWMDKLYSGECAKSDVDVDKGVSAYLALSDNHVVAYSFNGKGWNQERGRSWIKNRKMNEIVWRPHADGSVFVNSILLSGTVSKTYEGEDAEGVIGKDKYETIMAIEREHGSLKPFVLEITAMDFKGKKTLVANQLKFFRDQVNEDIKSFTHLPIHLGHIGVFEDYQNPVGNTVFSHVDSKSNPSAFAYIYPHGVAGDFRTNLKLAAAQGEEMLGRYPVSMRGTPTKFEVQEREGDYEPSISMSDFVYAEVYEWTKKALDFVDTPAIEGSGPRRIVNSKDIEPANETKTFVQWKGAKNVEPTLSDALAVLRNCDTIAFSDIYSIPACKEAIDRYVESEVQAGQRGIAKDEKFQMAALEEIDSKTLAEIPKVAEIVNSAVQGKADAVEERKKMVTTLCETKEIKLSKGQQLYVMEGINGDEDEAEILKRIQGAQEMADLAPTEGFSLSSKTTVESSNGAVMREATQDEIANRYQP